VNCMDDNTKKKPAKQKRQSILRLIIQCLSFAFHNGYASGWIKGKIYTGDNKMFCMPGLNCYSCPGAIGACPIGSLQAVLNQTGFHLSLYVLGFIGAVGALCGRFICGWLCPFGLIQDLIYRIPFFKKVKNLPGHKYLRYLRFVILALLVIILPIGIRNQAGVGQPWFCEYICPSGTLLGGIPLTIANAQLRALIGPRFIWKLFILVLILVAALISDRPFCKYICPLGALYGLANPISIYRYKIDKESCIGCGACQKACGGDIRVWENPNSMDCIRCGKCIAACPTGALYTSFTIKGMTQTQNGNCPQSNNYPQSGNCPQSNNPVQDGKFAADTPAPEVLKTRSLGKKIAMVISGLLCTGISLYAIYEIYILVYLIVTSQSVPDILSFLKYLLGLILMLVPSVMMLLLGLGLMASLRLKPSIYEKIRPWPLHILTTIGLCAIATLIGFFIISLLVNGNVSGSTFSYAILLSLSAFALAVPLAIVAFIAWLVCRQKKHD